MCSSNRNTNYSTHLNSKRTAKFFILLLCDTWDYKKSDIFYTGLTQVWTTILIDSHLRNIFNKLWRTSKYAIVW